MSALPPLEQDLDSFGAVSGGAAIASDRTRCPLCRGPLRVEITTDGAGGLAETVELCRCPKAKAARRECLDCPRARDMPHSPRCGWCRSARSKLMDRLSIARRRSVKPQPSKLARHCEHGASCLWCPEARRLRGRCQRCKREVSGMRGRSLYCVSHKREVQREGQARYYRRNQPVRLALAKRWQARNRKQHLSYNRKYNRTRPKRLDRSNERVYGPENPPECRRCGVLIEWDGRGRPCERCPPCRLFRAGKCVEDCGAPRIRGGYRCRPCAEEHHRRQTRETARRRREEARATLPCVECGEPPRAWRSERCDPCRVAWRLKLKQIRNRGREHRQLECEHGASDCDCPKARKIRGECRVCRGPVRGVVGRSQWCEEHWLERRRAWIRTARRRKGDRDREAA